MSLSRKTLSVLPEDAAKTWEIIAPHLPGSYYLGGGTGIAVHLHHRESRDLDFFTHEHVDIAGWEQKLRKLGPLAVTERSPNTVNGVFSKTKVQFLEVSQQQCLRPASNVDGIPVASIDDLLAMKIKTIRDRNELRDFFDIMVIEERANRTIEEGVALFLKRYTIDDADAMLHQVVRCMGMWDQLQDDSIVPVPKENVMDFWRRRHNELLRNLGRGIVPRAMPAPAVPLITPLPTLPPRRDVQAGLIWVDEHIRTGRRVRGYWRKQR